jgi:catechol 2,3-dioxygenase-like lactoylglutathione lyase family enzyme
MLKRVDRVQIAVRDAAAAARTIGDILGSEILARDEVAPLGTRRTTIQAGTSLIELLEPAGNGPVADYVNRWESGLFGAGFSVADIQAAASRLKSAGASFTAAGGQLFVEPAATAGMRVVLSAYQERAPVGLIKWIYEVTNVIGNWRSAAERYAKLFGLDASRFVPIASEEFGYAGSLLMFDAPARLDRIELSQITEPEKAMGRFHSRRGDSLYMFYVEADDVAAIALRLEQRGARFAVGRRDGAGLSGIFVHPTAFCGVLVGVSRTENAWLWSGDPERARRAATQASKRS